MFGIPSVVFYLNNNFKSSYYFMCKSKNLLIIAERNPMLPDRINAVKTELEGE